MKKHLTLLVLFITFISSPSYAEGKWQFVMDLEYCYIQSSPIKTEIPDGKSMISNGDHVFGLQSCCTERSTHTCARVPADLAQAPDGGGKVGGGSKEGFYWFLHTEL